jgi:rubrerythrin
MEFKDQLEKAISDEWTAYSTYKELMKMTNNPLYKDWIEHAKEDEKKHYQSFQQVYYGLTGQFFQNVKKTNKYNTFKEGALNALIGELEAAEMYRDMIFNLPTQQVYKPIYIAMTDEMEHAIRFSTIYNSL